MSQDPLADYASKMREVKASDKLRARVLKREQAETLGKHGVAAVRIQHPHTRASKRVALRYSRVLPKALGMAACLILVVVGVSFATGIFSLPSNNTADQADTTFPNSFTLMAYAAEHPEDNGAYDIDTDASDFNWNGSSGPYYDPDSKQFWDGSIWTGYKFALNLKCVGQNVASLSYEIRGDHAYFETIDEKKNSRIATQDEKDSDSDSAYSYSKSVTLPYDRQKSIQDDKITSIYLGFPISQEAQDINTRSHNLPSASEQQEKLSCDFYAHLDTEAALALSRCELVLTATFTDGETQIKHFVLKPQDDFEQKLRDYWAAVQKCEWYDRQRTLHPGQEESDNRPETPLQPAIFTMQELPDE